VVITASRVLVVIALICFVLAAFHVGFPVDILAAGLAFLAASFLVP
jgi:hypothetical protein